MSVTLHLSRELGAGIRWHQLGCLEQLHDCKRLGLGARSRFIELAVRKEDDEPQQESEPGCQDTEDAGGAITVAEVPPFGSPPRSEEHTSELQSLMRIP